jgi:hypothetical protein
MIYTIIQTANLNFLDPEAHLRDNLAASADHPISKIDQRLPWNWAKCARPDTIKRPDAALSVCLESEPSRQPSRERGGILLHNPPQRVDRPLIDALAGELC